MFDPKTSADKKNLYVCGGFRQIVGRRAWFDQSRIRIYSAQEDSTWRPQSQVWKLQFQKIWHYMDFNPRRHKGGGSQSDPPPSIFLALNFCSLTDYQKLWHNCSLFVKRSFDPN